MDIHFCFQAIQVNLFSTAFNNLHDLFLKLSSTPYRFSVNIKY